MAKARSVRKNIRKSQRRRKRNLTKKKIMKSAIRQVKKASTQKSAMKSYPETQSIIDKSIQDRIIKKRKAARLKSRLIKTIKTKK